MSVQSMTADRLDASVEVLRDVVRVLHDLGVPADRVASLAVEHWPGTPSPTVAVHIDGADAVGWVDRIADHYGLPPARHEHGNYTRGAYLGRTPVLAFCGDPDDSGAGA